MAKTMTDVLEINSHTKGIICHILKKIAILEYQFNIFSIT